MWITQGVKREAFISRGRGLVSLAPGFSGCLAAEGRAGGPGGDPARGTGAQVGTSGIVLGCR